MMLNLSFSPKAFARLFSSCPYPSSLSIVCDFSWVPVWAGGWGLRGDVCVSFFQTLGSRSNLQGPQGN